ncbi:hypothetical protein LINPERHAP1_LOCUS26353 [Linum perenne]
MGRAAFFSTGSMRGTGDIRGFTLLVELWALERFPRIAERYIQGFYSGRSYCWLKPV